MHKRSIGINNYNITQKCERKKNIFIYIKIKIDLYYLHICIKRNLSIFFPNGKKLVPVASPFTRGHYISKQCTLN